MILPNLCFSIQSQFGLPCVSVVVPHPSYLEEWKRVEDPDGDMVVDGHTVELMRMFGYSVHKMGEVITGIELNCVEDDLKEYMNGIKIN